MSIRYVLFREQKGVTNSTFLFMQDYVVVGSDSGRIVILEYNATKNSFDRVHMETFGEWN